MTVKTTAYVPWYIIAYKFIFGFIEFISGLAIILIGKKALTFYQNVILPELSEDPHVYLVHLSQKIMPMLFTHHTSLVIYLILLGLAKMAGAVGLIYHQNWGVDLLVGLTVILLPFQTINLVLHPSVFDFFYIILGLLIALYLIDFQPKEWTKKIVHHVRNGRV